MSTNAVQTTSHGQLVGWGQITTEYEPESLYLCESLVMKGYE